MAELDKIAKTAVVIGVSMITVFAALSFIGPNTLKYKLPTPGEEPEQLYDVHTEISLDLSTNQAQFNEESFYVRTVPTKSKAASFLDQFLPSLSFAGAKNVQVTQTIDGPTGNIRKTTDYGNLGEGQVKEIEFDADAWPPGTYKITYELTQSCSIIDIGLGIFCKPNQQLKKTFEVPQP